MEGDRTSATPGQQHDRGCVVGRPEQRGIEAGQGSNGAGTASTTGAIKSEDGCDEEAGTSASATSSPINVDIVEDTLPSIPRGWMTSQLGTGIPSSALPKSPSAPVSRTSQPPLVASDADAAMDPSSRAATPLQTGLAVSDSSKDPAAPSPPRIAVSAASGTATVSAQPPHSGLLASSSMVPAATGSMVHFAAPARLPLMPGQMPPPAIVGATSTADAPNPNAVARAVHRLLLEREPLLDQDAARQHIEDVDLLLSYVPRLEASKDFAQRLLDLGDEVWE